MKPLRACAALAALASPLAQGNFADALLQSGRTPDRATGITVEEPQINAGSNLEQCVSAINHWRKGIETEALLYKAQTGNSGTDLDNFLKGKGRTCEELKTGRFPHLSTTQSRERIFIFTAEKPKDAEGGPMSCELAFARWRNGIGLFDNKGPPPYEENAANGPYADPDAIGLVALLQELEETTFFCGIPKECSTEDFVLCYIKPSTIAEGNPPAVPRGMWNSFELAQNLKPVIDDAATARGSQKFLDPVNAVRRAEGLDLAEFTELSERSGLDRNFTLALDTYLYETTCEGLMNSKLDPAPSDEFSVIYYVKDGTTAPTLQEAVDYWQTGFAKLNYEIPPVFKKATDKAMLSSADPGEASHVEASKIYNDSAVAGYVSIMTEGTRKMGCLTATGCGNTKSALVCVIHKATLVDGQRPISEATWTKYAKVVKSRRSSEASGASKAALIGTFVMTLAAGAAFL